MIFVKFMDYISNCSTQNIKSVLQIQLMELTLVAALYIAAAYAANSSCFSLRPLYAIYKTIS